MGIPLCMNEATASGQRVAYARVCIEIEASFSFPRSTLMEVEGICEDIAVDYDEELKPYYVCDSFEHESGSCSPFRVLGPPSEADIAIQE